MFQEELYFKNQFVAWYLEFGYVGVVLSSDMVSKDRLKRYIQNFLVMDARSNEARNKIFVKWPHGVVFFVSYS